MLEFYELVELVDGLRVERYPDDDRAGLIYIELSLPVRHPIKFWQRRRMSLRLTQEQAIEFAQLLLREHMNGQL